MKRSHLLILPIFASVVIGAAPATAGLDLVLYGRLLAEHTREVEDVAGTRVDYAGLADAPDWRRLVEGLASSDTGAFGSRAEKLAFWINAYNVLAIDTVVRNYPVDSIRDVGSVLRSVWRREAGRVGGRPVTLYEIEHDILRSLGEPRIHAAIVCASLSCPPLARAPFRAETLGAQLDANLRRWLRDPRKGVRVDAARNRIQLSRIFRWFDEDFAAGGGVLAFVAPYLDESDRAFVTRRGEDASLTYLDYDWSLNDTSPGAWLLLRVDPRLQGQFGDRRVPQRHPPG